MTETRLTAALPHLDVEILRREQADPPEQELIIRLRAAPTFRAAAEHLAGRLAGDVLPAAPFLLASPMSWWAEMWRAAWQPWLALVPALPASPGEGAGLVPRRDPFAASAAACKG